MSYVEFVEWIRDARERVIATAVYLVGAIASVQVVIDNTGLLQQEWQQFTAIGGVALALNVIKVIAATKVGEHGTAAARSHTSTALEGSDPYNDECGVGAVCDAIAGDEEHGTN